MDKSKRTKQKSKKESSKGHSRPAMEASVMFMGYGIAGEVSRLNGVDDGAATLQVFNDISEATARIKGGDLSDVERVLTEQLFLMHSLTRQSSAWYQRASLMPHKKLALQAVSQSSRATRQIASAIATIKRPKRFTVIEKQQNVMVNGADAQSQNQLGESQDAPMDTGSQGAPAPIDAEAKAVA